MRQYLDLLERILEHGVERPDRTKTGTRSVFGHMMRFDLSAGFPLLTTKKLHTRSIIYELLWMIRGETNVRWLQENRVRIWNEWADKDGELGPIYGKQWRAWSAYDQVPGSHPPIFTERAVDQLKEAVDRIRSDPYSRRHVVIAWDPGEIPKMALPACHMMYQFYVADGKLSCLMYQRSADVFLGVPFNIASYALLTMMIAHVTGLSPGEFVHALGDAHLYLNHLEQARLQIAREPKRLPRMSINSNTDDILGFKYEDFVLEEYEAWPHIAAPVAV